MLQDLLDGHEVVSIQIQDDVQQVIIEDPEAFDEQVGALGSEEVTLSLPTVSRTEAAKGSSLPMVDLIRVFDGWLVQPEANGEI